MLRSFFAAGFECSCQRRVDGTRLDLLSSTGHSRLALRDYGQVRALGMKTVRDGIRWHLVDRGAGGLRWDSWLPMLRASLHSEVQVIWDLCHYGWPDDLDIWSGAFVERFARYAEAAAQLIKAETDEIPYFCPINEISYWAWAGGEVGLMGPGTIGRGAELKRQLVRAYIASVEAIRSVAPRARFIVAEPLIHVECPGASPDRHEAAESYRQAQFETHDMLVGRAAPELGGRRGLIDLVGVNFYPDNQWYLNGNTIPLGHHAYRPLRTMLREVYQRYGLPLFIAETGAEGDARPYWLHHVCDQVRHAIEDDVPVIGLCLYPVLDYHGWENSRVCKVGLLSMPSHDGNRALDPDLTNELRRWTTAGEWFGQSRLLKMAHG